MIQSLISWFSTVQTSALLTRQRRLIVILGDELWHKNCVESVFSVMVKKYGNGYENGTNIAPNLFLYQNSIVQNSQNFELANHQNFRHFLGRETNLLIFDGREKFWVDDFTALSGTVLSGGLILLQLPSNALDITYHKKQQNYFNAYFADKINADNNVLVLKQGMDQLPVLLTADHITEKESSNNFQDVCKTAEQATAVVAIKKVLSGHRKRPLVLTADRGRGKSSALAIAVADIISNNTKHIVITAPQPQALTVFFAQLTRCLPAVTKSANKWQYQSSTVQFMPFDLLNEEKINCDLLLVDEAAGIPVPQLLQLVCRYHRAVFSSTVHGYEGAGRGFTLKFMKALDSICPQRQVLHINQPIRWAKDDPVEAFLFNTFLLKSAPVYAEFDKNSAVTFNTLDSKALYENPALFHQVFSLLVNAHYQTKPSDIVMLLNDKSISVIAMMQGNALLAAALLITEGEIDSALATDIATNKRRVKGHLLPQTLLTQRGENSAFNYRYCRVVRIAVQQEITRQGLGHRLLNEVIAHCRRDNIDVLGTAFGANAGLLSFWQQAHLTLVHLGFSKDQASGEFSAMLLLGLNDNAKSLVNRHHQLFSQNFPLWLFDEFKTLSADLVWQIVQKLDKTTLPSRTFADQEALEAYCDNRRLYSPCAGAIWRWLLQYLPVTNLDTESLAVVISRCLQKQSWQIIAKQHGFTGQKSVEIKLIEALRNIKDKIQ